MPNSCPGSCPLHAFKTVCCSSHFYTVAGKITGSSTLLSPMQAQAGHCYLLLMSHNTVIMACYTRAPLPNQLHTQCTAEITQRHCKATPKEASCQSIKAVTALILLMSCGLHQASLLHSAHESTSFRQIQQLFKSCRC